MIGNIGNAIVGLIVIVVLISGLASFRHTNVDLLNPQTAAANAVQTRFETERQQQQWVTDYVHYQQERQAESALTLTQMENQKKIVEAETIATLNKIAIDEAVYRVARQNEVRLARLEQEQALAAKADRQFAALVIGTTTIITLILTLMAGALYHLVFTIKRPFSEAMPLNWSNIQYRREKIRHAREREQAARTWVSIRPHHNGHDKRIRSSAS
jgi:hypothetical protein